MGRGSVGIEEHEERGDWTVVPSLCPNSRSHLHGNVTLSRCETRYSYMAWSAMCYDVERAMHVAAAATAAVLCQGFAKNYTTVDEIGYRVTEATTPYATPLGPSKEA